MANIKSTLKNILRHWMIGRLKASGYSSFAANALYRKRMDDLFINNTTTFAQKIWAQKRGFFSSMTRFYGLSDHNCKNYLSDFDYYRLHPINGPYSKWIDDKLTIRYLLAPFSGYLPEYYFHISHKGEILRLADCPENIHGTIPDVIKLLKTKRVLVAKLKVGSKGEGFFKMAYDGQDYFINNEVSSEQAIEALITGWLKTREYLITQYVQSHPDLQKIFSPVPATLRILVIRERDQPARIAFAYINFATLDTGITNNAVAGGVYCDIDVTSGFFTDGKRSKLNNILLDGKYHPDTNVLVEGILPNWILVREKIIEISNYIPQVRFMGYDVIITHVGFKIIEINSHPGLSFMQLHHPLLKDETVKNFFTILLEEKK